jgi:hypothetical protein
MILVEPCLAPLRQTFIGEMEVLDEKKPPNEGWFGGGEGIRTLDGVLSPILP